MIPYIVWMWFDKAPRNGKGRRREWLRRASFWNYYRDYYPVHLHSMEKLDPSKNYLFGYHPMVF